MINKVVISGRLTRDPDMRGEGTSLVAKYTLAVDRKYQKDGEQQTDFISCVAFGKGAEFAEKYLKKGTKIVVCGRIQTGSYTNKEGQKIYTTDVIVEEHGEPAEKSGDNDFMDISPEVKDDMPF